jgi:putative FmdB family regulatory protein
MPIYEYRCEACEKITEAMQKFSDAPLTDCENCAGKGTLSKLISRSSFALKGSGWYTTDYKRAGKPTGDSTTPAAAGSSAPNSAASGSGDSAAKESVSTTPSTKVEAPKTGSGSTSGSSTPAK